MKVTAVKTELGWIGLAVSVGGIAGLLLPQSTYKEALKALRERWPDAVLEPPEAMEEIQGRIRRSLGGESVTFAPEIFDLSEVTRFQRRVLETALNIPPGETRSYSWVAREIGSPKAYRAVGQALGANPIPILIPCHRVVASDGSLGGYGGGLEMKRQLLARESRQRPSGDSADAL